MFTHRISSKSSVVSAAVAIGLIFASQTAAQCLSGAGVSSFQAGSQSWATGAGPVYASAFIGGSITGLTTSNSLGAITMMASQGNGRVWVIDNGARALYDAAQGPPGRGIAIEKVVDLNQVVWPVLQLRFAAGKAWVLGQDGTLVSASDYSTTLTSPDVTPTNLETLRNPSAMAFDGTYMWVANGGPNLDRVKPATTSNKAEATPQPAPKGAAISDLFFDGIYLWAVDTRAGVVYELLPSTLAVVHQIDLPGLAGNKESMVFDGFYLWVGSTGGDLWKLNQNGSIAATYPIFAADLAFDGRTIFAVRPTSGNVTQIRVCDGLNMGNLVLPAPVNSIAFSGDALWMTPKTSSSSARLFIQ
jgi:hypothetical protein